MKVLVPLPTSDFDPTEVAIPWKILKSHNVEVTFATPQGQKAQADPVMVTGNPLGPMLSPFLRAAKVAFEAYAQLDVSPEFNSPQKFSDLKAQNFDGILLAGGHAPGMKEYLESKVLQNLVVSFFKSEKPVAAICHGVLLAARSKDPQTGKSILYGRKTTALPKFMENLAYRLSNSIFCAKKMGDYYRTYPEITVQEEVARHIGPGQYIVGPGPASLRSSLRDNAKNLSRGFTVKDGNYISARWPGDAHRFGEEFYQLLTSDHK